ncbi:hypothetical protein ABZ319_20880 [Nocardia sp. NPDC005978]|uniref:hypothetical protein n=1 Tax=Nocardia sp. NPDC005978 TaxID=3156725 RepID=UPI00339FF0D0
MKLVVAGVLAAVAVVAGAGGAQARGYDRDTVIVDSGDGAITMTYGAYVDWLAENAAELRPEVRQAGGCAAFIGGNPGPANEAPLGIDPFIAACKEALGL